jgi:5-amino-6-(5-phosphoribosylamino)uracil reductase/diaminohydroxyphosphoribosylaminopyrimidine deaminase/5-amino-6-(5-phosphoribosylamino)uracil reductase
MRDHAPRSGVTVSFAQTLDGRVATRDRQSQWISGAQSLVFVHSLRAQHEAIMVGVGTVLADNPRLTVRHVPGRDPVRIVVDSTLRTPLSAAVLANGAGTGTLLAVTERAEVEQCAAARALGATVLVLPADSAGQVDLQALLEALHNRGISTVMVEGGAALVTSLLRAQLVDNVAICIAPKILGTGLDAVGDLGIRVLSDSLQIDDMTVEHYGRDIMVTGRIVYSSREQPDDL